MQWEKPPERAAQPWDIEPREGGVKIVFDVVERDVHEIALQVAAAGFDVRRYDHREDEHRPGGSKPGYLRLGAEQPMNEFTDAEQDRIVAQFDAVHRASGFECERAGIDTWTSGGGDGLAGDREPRTPLPKAGAGPHSLNLERPREPGTPRRC